MINTSYTVNGKPISYMADDNGYDIYIDGIICISQREGYYPFAGETIEDKCVAHIENIVTHSGNNLSIDQMIQQITDMETQLTQAQLALCELYELIEV